MTRTFPPLALAGVTIAATGIAAVAPAPAMSALPDVTPISASPAIQLTAALTGDPLTEWLTVGNDIQVNSTALANLWLDAPNAWLQQIVVNQIGYLGKLPDIPGIIDQTLTNIGATLAVAYEKNDDNIGPDQEFVIAAASALFPELEPLLDFTTTDNSGIIMGLVGTLVSPWLAFGDQWTAFTDNIGTDPAKALNALLNMPAALTNAGLNGYGRVDLGTYDLPIPLTTLNAGLWLGGLLSPAGTIITSVDALVKTGIVTIVDMEGAPAGPLGSILNTPRSIAKAIGWDGTGNPLDPPLPAPFALSAVSDGLAPADTVPPSVLDSEETKSIEVTAELEALTETDPEETTDVPAGLKDKELSSTESGSATKTVVRDSRKATPRPFNSLRTSWRDFTAQIRGFVTGKGTTKESADPTESSDAGKGTASGSTDTGSEPKSDKSAE